MERQTCRDQGKRRVLRNIGNFRDNPCSLILPLFPVKSGEVFVGDELHANLVEGVGDSFPFKLLEDSVVALSHHLYHKRNVAFLNKAIQFLDEAISGFDFIGVYLLDASKDGIVIKSN